MTDSDILLLETAREKYPIGTKYTTASRISNTVHRVTTFPTFLVGTKDIEAGFGYIYYHGVWAPIIELPESDLEKARKIIYTDI